MTSNRSYCHLALLLAQNVDAGKIPLNLVRVAIPNESESSWDSSLGNFPSLTRDFFHASTLPQIMKLGKVHQCPICYVFSYITPIQRISTLINHSSTKNIDCSTKHIKSDKYYLQTLQQMNDFIGKLLVIHLG